MATIKKVYTLNNLGCANCANKIEERIGRLEEVESATLNFTTKKIIIFSEEYQFSNIEEKSNKIIKSLEPDVEMVLNDNKVTETYDSMDKKHLMKISISAIIYAVVLIFNFSETTEFILFGISYLIVGVEVLYLAYKNIRKGEVFDENFLMCLATIGAFAIGEYSEGVAVMLFYQVGEFFQDIAVNKSRKSITSLMDIRPDFANLEKNGEITKVDPDDVSIGETIVVKIGDRVPLDGVVLIGESMVDTSALTGESVPRKVRPGDSILSGTINKNALLKITTTKTFGESSVSKILDMVENASNKKAPTEQFITKFAKLYTPIVVLIAVVIAFLTPLIFNITIADSVSRALVFLVVSCPCALVISIPLGFFGGIGCASKNGILVKGGNYLEALNGVDTVVFDKTGTLTKGVFEVIDIKAINIDKDELMKYTAYAESYSTHPIANSIVRKFGKDVDKTSITEYEEISGRGVLCKVDGRLVAIGNEKLMNDNSISIETPKTFGTTVHIAIDNLYCGYIVISDIVKEDSKKAIQGLKKLGIRNIVMLTGDSEVVAEKVAKELGIDNYYSSLLPEDKVAKLEELDKSKKANSKLLFVGDGINDAPVLARADIGVSMGGIGSDVAIEASDVVLMTDEPAKLVDVIKISKATKGIVMQNIIFAMSIKILILSMGVFGFATMWEAVFADVGVTLIAIFNTMRLTNYNKKNK